LALAQAQAVQRWLQRNGLECRLAFGGVSCGGVQAEQALAAAERIENAYGRSWAYRAVALALAQAGQIEQAQEAFQQALAAAERIENA
jgi:Tfp pilus assembly protein PilF